jgi:hypothetical protein
VSLRKSSLFFLTALPTLESVYLEIGWDVWESTLIFDVSDALTTALENPRERFIRTPGRTHNRIRSPR